MSIWHLPYPIPSRLLPHPFCWVGHFLLNPSWIAIFSLFNGIPLSSPLLPLFSLILILLNHLSIFPILSSTLPNLYPAHCREFILSQSPGCELNVPIQAPTNPEISHLSHDIFILPSSAIVDFHNEITKCHIFRNFELHTDNLQLSDSNWNSHSTFSLHHLVTPISQPHYTKNSLRQLVSSPFCRPFQLWTLFNLSHYFESLRSLPSFFVFFDHAMTSNQNPGNWWPCLLCI